MSSDPRPLPAVVPGEMILAAGDLPLRHDQERVQVTVTNTSVWPVTITSHFHFFEANRRLAFDRDAAFGMHLDVVAGGSVRIDPGETRQVELVPFRGQRALFGVNGLTNTVLGFGRALDQQRSQAVQRARAAGYLDSPTS